MTEFSTPAGFARIPGLYDINFIFLFFILLLGKKEIRYILNQQNGG